MGEMERGSKHGQESRQEKRGEYQTEVEMDVQESGEGQRQRGEELDKMVQKGKEEQCMTIDIWEGPRTEDK